MRKNNPARWDIYNTNLQPYLSREAFRSIIEHPIAVGDAVKRSQK